MQEGDSEKSQRKQSIQYQYAFELFCQKRFQESFKIFAALETGNGVSKKVILLLSLLL